MLFYFKAVTAQISAFVQNGCFDITWIRFRILSEHFNFSLLQWFSKLTCNLRHYITFATQLNTRIKISWDPKTDQDSPSVEYLKRSFHVHFIQIWFTHQKHNTVEVIHFKHSNRYKRIMAQQTKDTIFYFNENMIVKTMYCQAEWLATISCHEQVEDEPHSNGRNSEEDKIERNHFQTT